MHIPEGFKLITNRRFKLIGDARSDPNRLYALSPKGEIYDSRTGDILVAPKGTSTITIREESRGYQYEASFDIPVLLSKYFGEDGEKEGLTQEDFDKLVEVSGLPADVCRVLLNSGWRYEVTTGAPAQWIKG